MAITKINIGGRDHNFSDPRIVGFDEQPTSGSGKLLTSGSVYAAISEIETAEECDNAWLNGELSNLFPLN